MYKITNSVVFWAFLWQVGTTLGVERREDQEDIVEFQIQAYENCSNPDNIVS
eukprot:Awhi_evm1s6846